MSPVHALVQLPELGSMKRTKTEDREIHIQSDIWARVMRGRDVCQPLVKGSCLPFVTRETVSYYFACDQRSAFRFQYRMQSASPSRIMFNRKTQSLVSPNWRALESGG